MNLIFFDFFIVAQMLIMDVCRQPNNYALYQVFSIQFQVNQLNLFGIKAKAEYEFQFDCRRIYFEHYLNDKHDNLLRRIFIRDVVESRYTYVYNRQESNENVFLFNRSELEEPTFLYNRSELSNLVDFEVVLPIGLVYIEEQLKGHIEIFKLPGLKYIIVEE